MEEEVVVAYLKRRPPSLLSEMTEESRDKSQLRWLCIRNSPDPNRRFIECESEAKLSIQTETRFSSEAVLRKMCNFVNQIRVKMLQNFRAII
jgi:hypothetical protein